MIVAPVEDQTSELLRKVIEAYHAVGDLVPVRREAVTRLELVNGSQVIALPGIERRMRSFTAELLLMRLQSRLRWLEAALPKCSAALQELVSSDNVPTEADRCPCCGGYHFLVVHEEIVEARPSITRRFCCP